MAAPVPVRFARYYRQASLFLVGGLLLSCFFTAAPAFSQQHFADCATRTGNNATIIIPDTTEITLDGEAIKEGDELAVFNKEGRCAGAATWTGKSVVLTVWGTNEVTAATDGLGSGDRMRFRIWDASAHTEYTDARDSFYVSFSGKEPHLTTENQYVPNGIYLLTALRIDTSHRVSR